MTVRMQDIYRLFEKSGFKVSTDTRKIEQGALFFALKGENFNGNLFAEKALENGASHVIVDEQHVLDERVVLMEDALKCLQDLATMHRQKLGTRLLGIGGSNGKTTTKELIVSVLGMQYNTHYTHGNLNNHIGVPLTLLQLRPEHEVAVIELGANKMGDISELCDIAKPDLGIITNIGKEHLEGFGGIEGVAKAESELFDFLLKHHGHAFINLDDEWLKSMGKRFKDKTEYGIQNLETSRFVTEPEINLTYKSIRIRSKLMGIHNLQNIMAAISVAEHFEVPLEKIKVGIEKYSPTNNRSQMIRTEKGNMVLLDAYNANPSSVEMALKSLESMPGFKVALLGDMFELGAYEAAEHQHIVEKALELHIHTFLLVGKAFNKTQLPKGSESIFKFENKEEAHEFIKGKNYKNCAILIKGSRGMKMEEFLTEF
jgi:UDP-N-acetylmuramoyl-tripeptide--D-alanyl-D-alanine ligase